MNTVKMGFTIEEAAECTGIGREYHAEAGGLEQAARAEGRAQDHYPQGHAGAVYDRQSGEKSSEAR